MLSFEKKPAIDKFLSMTGFFYYIELTLMHKFYFSETRYFSGNIGIAPFCVHTKAETSTAFL